MGNCKEEILKLEKKIQDLKEQCKIEEDANKHKFKIGDWVCFNHGEYPNYICREPWQITNWSYEYSSRGTPIGRVHSSPGMAHDECHLRYAHPDEISYYLSGLPYIFNKKTRTHDTIDIIGNNFKIGEFDTRDLHRMNGKELISFILDLSLIDDNKNILFKIFEKMK